MAPNRATHILLTQYLKRKHFTPPLLFSSYCSLSSKATTLKLDKLSNICDEAFLQKLLTAEGLNFFCKKLYHRCLKDLQVHLRGYLCMKKVFHIVALQLVLHYFWIE